MKRSSIISPIRGSICIDIRTRRGQPGPSAEAKVIRITSDIDRVRERSEGVKANWKDAANRVEAVEGRKRERDEAERIRGKLGKGEVIRYRIITKIQEFRRSKNDFDEMMEDFGVRRDERLLLVKSDIEYGGRQGELVCRSRKTVPIGVGQGK